MKSKFSESEVHQYVYSKSLEALTEDERGEAEAFPSGSLYEENGFELWRLIKFRAKNKIRRIYESIRYGELVRCQAHQTARKSSTGSTLNSLAFWAAFLAYDGSTINLGIR